MGIKLVYDEGNGETISRNTSQQAFQSNNTLGGLGCSLIFIITKTNVHNSKTYVYCFPGTEARMRSVTSCTTNEPWNVTLS